MRQRHKRRSQAKSSLNSPAINSKLWNAAAQQWPAFNNTLKKDNSIHKFVQLIDLNTVITSNTSANVAYSRAFAFNDLPQVTSLQTLFDQYRITDIEVWLNPGIQAGSTYNPGTSGYMYTVTDYDDAANLASPSAALQYTNVMQGPSQMGHYRKWKPHVAEALYGGAFTSFGNIAAPWIDMASPGVQHYGFKAITTAASSSSNVTSWSLTVRYHFETRNVF
jgi:hypothetical protein